MPERRKLIAGNWKMNGLAPGAGTGEGSGGTLGAAGPVKLRHAGLPAGHARPFRRGSRGRHPLAWRSGLPYVEVGCPYRRHQRRDAGRSLAAHVIVGHSERRQNHGEDDALVSSKATAAHAAG